MAGIAEALRLAAAQLMDLAERVEEKRSTPSHTNAVLAAVIAQCRMARSEAKGEAPRREEL